jgi:hypothetical protein
VTVRRRLSSPLAVILLVAALPLALAAAAAADDWQLLGRRQVSFAVDKDVIDVGARDGLFNAIRIEVQDGDLELDDVRVVLGNGTSWSPNTRVSFREGSRSREIDLPGATRMIRRIDFSYRSVRGGQWSRATVHVYGRR